MSGSYFGKNVHGRIAQALGERILRGELTPGSVLPPEAELSRRLGISRSALREAIKLLFAKGLVESRPKVGTRVRPRACWNLLDPDLLAWQAKEGGNTGFLERLLELRLLIEPAAAALAALRCQPSEIIHMKQAIDWLDQATAPDEEASAFAAFYRVVLGATHNDLLGALHMLSQHIGSFDRDQKSRIVSLCRELSEAVSRRDEKCAENAMRELVLFCE